jgi:hypothetical protein
MRPFTALALGVLVGCTPPTEPVASPVGVWTLLTVNHGELPAAITVLCCTTVDRVTGGWLTVHADGTFADSLVMESETFTLPGPTTTVATDTIVTTGTLADLAVTADAVERFVPRSHLSASLVDLTYRYTRAH